MIRSTLVLVALILCFINAQASEIFSSRSNEAACEARPDIDIDIGSGQMTANNLGGKGPKKNDPHMIRYENVGFKDGQAVHLEVTIRAGMEDKYNTNGENGRNGDFGKVQLNGGENKMAHLRYTFKYSDGTPVAFDILYMTYFDIDGDKNNLERLTFETEGFSYKTVTGTKLKRDTVGGKVRFSNTKGRVDNPNKIHKLSNAQKKVSVLVEYKNVHNGYIDVDYCCSRTMMFAGVSASMLENACPLPPTCETYKTCSDPSDVKRPFAKQIYCASDPCTDAECCESDQGPAECSSLVCPVGRANKPNEFCASSACTASDTETCCAADTRPSCSTYSPSCPAGSLLDSSVSCAADPCTVSDEGTCCQPSSYTCTDSAAGKATNVITSHIVSTDGDCEEKCDDDSTCVAFDFTSVTAGSGTPNCRLLRKNDVKTGAQYAGRKHCVKAGLAAEPVFCTGTDTTNYDLAAISALMFDGFGATGYNDLVLMHNLENTLSLQQQKVDACREFANTELLKFSEEKRAQTESLFFQVADNSAYQHVKDQCMVFGVMKNPFAGFIPVYKRSRDIKNKIYAVDPAAASTCGHCSTINCPTGKVNKHAISISASVDNCCTPEEFCYKGMKFTHIDESECPTDMGIDYDYDYDAFEGKSTNPKPDCSKMNAQTARNTLCGWNRPTGKDFLKAAGFITNNCKSNEVSGMGGGYVYDMFKFLEVDGAACPGDCSSFSCPIGRPNIPNSKCVGYPCVEGDTDTCCEAATPHVCSNSNGIFASFHPTSASQPPVSYTCEFLAQSGAAGSHCSLTGAGLINSCAGQSTCHVTLGEGVTNEARLADFCAVLYKDVCGLSCLLPAAKCTSAVVTCPTGEGVNPNNDCAADPCVDGHEDRGKCCEVPQSCSQMSCPTGRGNIPSNRCAGPVCNADDTDRCCEPMPSSPASCSTFNVPCPNGKSVNSGNNCGADPCTPADQSNCCEDNALCSTYNCPNGRTNRPSNACGDLTCGSTDTDNCCDPVPSPASCSTFNVPCPNGKSVNSANNCGADPCTPGDQSNCCEDNASCSTYNCPNGRTNRPSNVCGGLTCGSTDTDACCDPIPSTASCSTFNVPCPNGQSVNSASNCDADPCTPADQINCCEPNASCGTFNCPNGRTKISANTCGGLACVAGDTDTCCQPLSGGGSCGSHVCPSGTNLDASANCASASCVNSECCTGSQEEFEECRENGQSAGLLCGEGLTCKWVNRFYSQCRASSPNSNCPSQSITVSPAGLNGGNVTLDVWFVNSGGTANVSCSQGGDYSGMVRFQCDVSGTLSYLDGDCFPEDYCQRQNVSYTDSTGEPATFNAWYSEAGDELTGACSDGRGGHVTFKCPEDSSEGTVGTLFYVEDNCHENCFDNRFGCNSDADCCGNLVCVGSGDSAQCMPQCRLPSDYDSLIDNVNTTRTSCSGTTTDASCQISCQDGYTLYGCPQCKIDGQDFILDNVRCVADGSTPACDCWEGFFVGEASRAGKSYCQGPDGRCFDRHGQTQEGSGRCGEASALEIHWGQEGECQLAWECELTDTCSSAGWDDTKCQTEADLFFASRSGSFYYEERTFPRNTANIGCGNFRECSVDLCCQEKTCGRWLRQNTGTCEGLSLIEAGADKVCTGGNCTSTNCCIPSTTCSSFLESTTNACTIQGLVIDIKNSDHLCDDTVGGDCSSKCCVATCGTAKEVVGQDGFKDALCRCSSNDTNSCYSGQDYNSFESRSLSARSDVICGKTNKLCDPLKCCEHVTCKDVYEEDSTFCTSQDLTNVEFDLVPCGRNTTDCIAEYDSSNSRHACCTATCLNYWSARPSSCPEETRNIDNRFVICGLRTSHCADSLCCTHVNNN